VKAPVPNELYVANPPGVLTVLESAVPTPVPRPVIPASGAATAEVLAAVIKPLALIVKLGIVELDPNDPTLVLTVASVATKLLVGELTSPDSATVSRMVPENVNVDPSVIPPIFAREPVGLPTSDDAATC
jgi:hypothetical protein